MLFRAAMTLSAEQDGLLGAQEDVKGGLLDSFPTPSPKISYLKGVIVNKA